MAEFASNGKGNLGVTLGAIGTGLAAFGNSGVGNGLLGGIFGNNSCAVKDEKIDALQTELMKEKSERYTDQKICELKGIMYDKFENVNNSLCAQNVWNATNTSTISCLTNQVNQLASLMTYGIASNKIISSTTASTT